MNYDTVLKFLLGASRAGFLTMVIMAAGQLGFVLSTFLIISFIGGYMTVTQK